MRLSSNQYEIRNSGIDKIERITTKPLKLSNQKYLESLFLKNVKLNFTIRFYPFRPAFLKKKDL